MKNEQNKDKKSSAPQANSTHPLRVIQGGSNHLTEQKPLHSLFAQQVGLWADQLDAQIQSILQS